MLGQKLKRPVKVRISLIDCEKLLDLLIRHKIGVTAEQYTVYSSDEEWWDDVAGKADTLPAQIAVEEPVATQVTYPLPIRAIAHSQTYKAELLDRNGRVHYNGAEYQTPSKACRAASGRETCNGWLFWRYQNPETSDWRPIKELLNI
ncbi:MAG: hypothetical protein AABN33_28590 [Acidobacteriota bacterium]